MIDQQKHHSIRSEFPALKTQVHGKPLVYLDSAASTLKCQSVLKELDQHYYHETANIHRGVHYLSELGTQKYEATRIAAQNFIGASKTEEIIFTKGTTDGINLVASSWGEKELKAGDVILLSTMEHHSNIVPWQLIAEKKNAKVVEIPINDNGEILMNEYQKLLSSHPVKMVSIVHISNSLGTINPIKEMVRLAHENGALFCVDGAQAVAHQEIDVKDLDCDFYAFSGHKIYGPTGTGILFGKKEHLESMPPYQGGGDMIDVVTFEKTTYNDLPHKFEAGTPHIAGFIGLKFAFDFLTSYGLKNIEQYEKEILDYAEKKLSDLEGFKIIGTAKNKAGVVSFDYLGLHPHDMGTILDQQGIAVRTGHHCTQPLMKRLGVTATARASLGIYTNKEEIDTLYAGLLKVKELLL